MTGRRAHRELFLAKMLAATYGARDAPPQDDDEEPEPPPAAFSRKPGTVP